MAVVYQITSPSGKQYIGVAKRSAAERFKKHCENVRRGHDTALARAIRKYGAEAMTIKTLVESTSEYCFDLEIKAIKAYNTLHPNGYNLTTGGEGVIEMATASKLKHAFAMKRQPRVDAASAAIRAYNARPEVKKRKSEEMTERWKSKAFRKHMKRLAEKRKQALIDLSKERY